MGCFKNRDEYLPNFFPNHFPPFFRSTISGIECYSLSLLIHSLKPAFDALLSLLLSETLAQSLREIVQSSRYVLLAHHIRCRPRGLRLCSSHHICIKLSKPDWLSNSPPCYPNSFRNHYWSGPKPCRCFRPQRSDQTNYRTSTRICRPRDGQYHQQAHRKSLRCRNLRSKRPFRLR